MITLERGKASFVNNIHRLMPFLEMLLDERHYSCIVQHNYIETGCFYYNCLLSSQLYIDYTFLSLVFVPCIIRHSRNNQLIYATHLFYILAPTCFDSGLP
jgi:hypothetical protein